MQETYTISTGRSRLETTWKSTSVTWEALLGRLAEVRRTKETVKEYQGLSRDRKGRIKDVGGFVGGRVEGARKAGNVRSRSLLTLDIDYGRKDTVAVVADSLAGLRWVLYSTHSHTGETPRYRLVVPLGRDVTPDEYVPVARKVAEWIGMDLFDDSTYQPERLMYWPSCPADGEYVLKSGEGEDLDPDEVLGEYVDWRNPVEWPLSSRVDRIVERRNSKQEDPTLKGGAIGAFCRAYSVSEAIEAFRLPYEPTDKEGRWTYTEGTTSGGAIVYEDKWLYSHHGTDPCSMRLVNAFDLVRIHRFGDADAEALPDTPVNRLPSFKLMEDLATSDPKVHSLLVRERYADVEDAFKDVEGEGPEEGPKTDGDDWMKQLQYGGKQHSEIMPTPYNFGLIIRNDPELKGLVLTDDFTGDHNIVRKTPWQEGDGTDHTVWNDSDDAGLIDYISRKYKLTGKTAIIDANNLVMAQNHHHPVREYLASLEWDGVPRLDTLFVDYLGAVDCDLTRAMTRKHFTAAVARVMQPGIKYDYILTLTGPEGIGKSTILSKMFGRWFDDSFSSGDVGDKQAMEQVRGRWGIELGELKDYKRSTSESFKQFLSKSVDKYRPAYGRHVVNIPRQCVFFATTNEVNFLKGDTGNRRFWVVPCYEDSPVRSVFEDLTDGTIRQVWAEAAARYKNHEKLFLDEDLERKARLRQYAFNEIGADDRIGIIMDFLCTPLPEDWETLTRGQRSEYFKTGSIPYGTSEKLTYRRKYICAAEIANECFRKDINRFEAREINQMLERLKGLEFVGSCSVSDRGYGCQRRFKISQEFYDHPSTVSEEAQND